MKIATYRVGGEHRAGVVDAARKTVAPFDLAEADETGNDPQVRAIHPGGSHG